ncbi:ComEA family DNA-binding protein [Larkinella soli]|uniref:ComEA family DNA-binding protein n=1 Tax=Larkinella soli TaxID=1770527 RepID=UPI001E37D2EF|nr:helix-hairpin-helix domain-containing protein [Larkinella soli]
MNCPLWRLALLTLLTSPAFSQDYRRPEADPGRIIQELFPVQAEGPDYQTVYDNLYQLYTTPLDLNTVTRDELSATGLLTERQLNRFFEYRSALGDLLSVYELQSVPDFDLPTIRRMLPFVTVGTGQRRFSLRNPANHSLTIRTERILERPKGFLPTEPTPNGSLPQRYAGGRQQCYLRYRYDRPRDYSFGLTLEQDPGEPLRWRPATGQLGVDYLSVHAQIQNRRRWRNIIVGDYQLQVGQGLVLGAGFSLGKGSETVAGVRRPTLGSRPYTSLSEYGFFRGLTATYALRPKLDITILMAQNRRDANLSENGRVFTALQTSGLHRTPAEQADRAGVREQNAGLHLHWHDGQRFQAGLVVLQTAFDKTFRKPDRPYNRYEFVGKRNTVVGLHGAYLRRNLNTFGEAARSSSGGIGLVGGAVASLTKRLDATLLGRYYDRRFQSFYAGAFGENSRNSNEKGLYTGLRYVVYRKLTLGAFADVYRFPWLKYLVDRPSRGFDYLFQATFTPTKRLTVQSIYHEEHKEKNLPAKLNKGGEVTKTLRKRYALSAEYTPSRRLSFHTRMQWAGFRQVGNVPMTGLALAQDVTLDLGRISVSGRLAWFDSDAYDSRLYLYERDVPSTFSIPAYTDRGLRHYVLVRWKTGPRLDLWLRWGRTDYFNRETVGSDLDQLPTSHKTEARLQAQWRF